MNFRGKRILILEGYARQCLPFLREFKKLGCETTLLCDSKLDCGWGSKLPDHKILGVCNPDRYEESEAYIVSLVKNGNFDIVFPLVDFGAEILAVNKTELSNYAFIASNDEDEFNSAVDKLNVMKVCAENNIPIPKTIFNIDGVDDIITSGIKFPVVIKPRKGCGARGFRKFQGLEELRSYISDSSNNINLSEMVIQECLPTDSKVVSENLFIDSRGTVKSAFLYMSHRVYPLKGGTGTYNETIHDDYIFRQSCKLVKLMNLKGCIGIDFMIDTRDGTAKVLEINPRVLACSQIGFDAGINQAVQILEDAFGMDVKMNMKYKDGVKVRMSQIDILCFLKTKNRFKVRPSFFQFKNTKDQMFRWSDPLPWFLFLLRGMKNYKNEMEKRGGGIT